MTQTILIIGAGVIGLACGAALARRGASVLIAEAEHAIGTGVSSRNSEVIHAGLYYRTGSLRAHHCVAGHRLMYAYAEQRGIPHQKIGKLIVATTDAECNKLGDLYAQGQANGAPSLKLIDGTEAQKMEPELRCSAAIWSAETGLIDSHALMLALQGEIEDHGGTIALMTKITRAERKNNRWRVSFSGLEEGTVDVDGLVNAAGLSAQRLARYMPDYPESRIPKQVLAKGNYFSYAGKPVFSHLIYPTPVDGGLGTHLTLDLAGRMKFGPDVEWITDESYSVDPKRVNAFYKDIRNYWPNIPDGSLIPDYCGIRPKLFGQGEPVADFIIDRPQEHGLTRLVQLFGIESPGLTSSLSIGDEVAAHIL